MAIIIEEYDGWAIKTTLETGRMSLKNAPENFLADIPTGKKVNTSPKKLLVQKVMGKLFL